MANREDNLTMFGRDIPPPSRDEAVKNGSLGGIASGEARREKKRIREALEKALNGNYDVNGERLGGYEAMAVKMVTEALNGNVQAFKEVRDTIGEKPIDEIGGDIKFNSGGLMKTIEALKRGD